MREHEHEWAWAGRAPHGDLHRCTRPGCRANPETAEPGGPCTGYDPEDD